MVISYTKSWWVPEELNLSTPAAVLPLRRRIYRESKECMARPSKVPKALQPMLATLIDAPFDSRDWVFETKWDGFRLVAKMEKGRVTLYSRSGLVVSDNYKPIAKALEKVKEDAVIDGELVALDAHGVSRFQLLQNALRTSANLHYCVFDIMFLNK